MFRKVLYGLVSAVILISSASIAFSQERTNEQIMVDIDAVLASDRTPRLKKAIVEKLVSELESVYRNNIKNSSSSASVKAIETDELRKIIADYKNDTTPTPARPNANVAEQSAPSVTLPIKFPHDAIPNNPIAPPVASRPAENPIAFVRTMLDDEKDKDDDAAKVEEKTPLYKLNKRVQVYFGTEIVGATSAASDAQPFFNVRMNAPIKRREACDNRYNLGCFSFWADFKFASSPTQTLPNFTSITGGAVSNFFGSNQSASINQLVKSFQTKIGLEYGIGENASFIGGAGVTSPLSSRESVQVYKIPRLANGTVLPAFQDIFGHIDYAGLDNLVLTTGERDRFLRNWFFGIRMRYPFYGDQEANRKKDLAEDRDVIAPALFDLTFGQDEVMSKKLIGAVMKFDATIPIKVNDHTVLYFGAAYGLKLTRRVNVTTIPFFLEPIANYNLFANNNLIRNFDDTPFATSNRDNYSFRIGVDLIRLLFGKPTSPDTGQDNPAGGKKPTPKIPLGNPGDH